MKTEFNKERFLKGLTHAQINASIKLAIDLQTIRRDFGDNLNTITILNTSSTSNINLYLNSEKIAFITKNNGSFSLDWRDGILYNSLEIENTDAVNNITANDIKISVGRTGV